MQQANASSESSQLQRVPALSWSVIHALAREVFCQPETHTLAAHRLLRSLTQWGARTGRHINAEGGMRLLAELVGMGSAGGDGRRSLAAALRAFEQREIPLVVGEKRLSFRLLQSFTRHGNVLRMEIGDALLPDFVFQFDKKTRSGREARRLVPVPPQMARFSGARRTWPSQATLQLLAWALIRERAVQLAMDIEELPIGAFAIWEHEWQPLIEVAGISKATFSEIREGWVDDRFMVPTGMTQGGVVWMLGQNYVSETEFIRCAGYYECRGSEQRGK